MKNLKFFLPMAALGLLASCSSDNLTEPGATPELTPVEADGSNVYLNIRLAMPSKGTRAASYDDGKIEEYAVEDAMLYIFDNTGSDGASTRPGKCVAVVELNDGETDPETPSPAKNKNITETISYEGIQMPSGISKGNTYWALVILNNKYISTPKINDVWKDWSEKEQSGAMQNGSDTYFTMTNANGWIGSYTGDPSILVKLGDDNFYFKSEGSATPVDVYVQRVLAKLSIGGTKDFFTTAVQPDGSAKADNKANVQMLGWYLDVYNSVTYPVQHIELSTGTQFLNLFDNATWEHIAKTTGTGYNNVNPLNRFISPATDTDFRRLYWAIDPNYDGEYMVPAPTIEPSVPGSLKNKDNIVYPRENTFSIAKMVQTESTRVVFSAQYNLTGANTAPSFIGINGKYLALDGTIPCKSDFLANNTSSVSKDAELDDAIKLSDIFENEQGDGKNYLDQASNYFNVGVNTAVDYYYEGKCWYVAIIRHFENDESGMPNDWELEKTKYTDLSDTDTYYGNTYLLGRFGIVRNNWYEIAINSVKGPGTPIVPTPDPNTPDDDPAKVLLDFDVHVLSWAKRSHSYDL